MSDSTLFVVRVWRRHEAFRASVRRVEDEDTRLFDTAIDLARYLEASTASKDAVRPLVPAPRGEPST